MEYKEQRGGLSRIESPDDKESRNNMHEYGRDKRYTMNFAMSEMMDALEEAERLFPFSKLAKEAKHKGRVKAHTVNSTNRLRAWQRCMVAYFKQVDTMQAHATRIKENPWINENIQAIEKELLEQADKQVANNQTGPLDQTKGQKAKEQGQAKGQKTKAEGKPKA